MDKESIFTGIVDGGIKQRLGDTVSTILGLHYGVHQAERFWLNPLVGYVANSLTVLLSDEHTILFAVLMNYLHLPTCYLLSL